MTLGSSKREHLEEVAAALLEEDIWVDE